jgi:hypothetical protein
MGAAWIDGSLEPEARESHLRAVNVPQLSAVIPFWIHGLDLRGDRSSSIPVGRCTWSSPLRSRHQDGGRSNCPTCGQAQEPISCSASLHRNTLSARRKCVASPIAVVFRRAIALRKKRLQSFHPLALQPAKVARHHPRKSGALNRPTRAVSSRSMGPDPRELKLR